ARINRRQAGSEAGTGSGELGGGDGAWSSALSMRASKLPLEENQMSGGSFHFRQHCFALQQKDALTHSCAVLKPSLHGRRLRVVSRAFCNAPLVAPIARQIRTDAKESAGDALSRELAAGGHGDSEKV